MISGKRIAQRITTKSYEFGPTRHQVDNLERGRELKLA